MRHRLMALLILALGVAIMVISGAELARTQQVYTEADEAYENLRDQIKFKAAKDEILPPTVLQLQIDKDKTDKTNKADKTDKTDKADKTDKTDKADAPPAFAPNLGIPRLDINFEALKAVGHDSAAWLYSPGTEIDYPVMRSDDYNYYLSRLPDGTYNANGSLFIDFNSDPEFGDSLTIIYGHNMKSRSMFGSLTDYKSQKYFDEHRYMYLYTEQGDYRIDLIYGFVIGAGKWREQAFMYKENLEALLSYASHNTTFESAAKYREGDRVVALSTCSYDFDGARYVVLGILRSER